MATRIAATALVLTAVACGAAFAATSATGTKVTLHATSHGKVLATEKGRTLYLSTGDARNKSRCDGSCLTYWPPLTTTVNAVASGGVHQSLLGKEKRSDGTFQVTYAGHPLYRYAGDTQPGQTNGEGLAGHWYVVKANGKKG
jgi:predicted lipoprotein with Yx(FWY)xxD motif